MEQFFTMAFGGATPNVRTTLQVSFRESIMGTTKRVTFNTGTRL